MDQGAKASPKPTPPPPQKPPGCTVRCFSASPLLVWQVSPTQWVRFVVRRSVFRLNDAPNGNGANYKGHPATSRGHGGVGRSNKVIVGWEVGSFRFKISP